MQTRTNLNRGKFPSHFPRPYRSKIAIESPPRKIGYFPRRRRRHPSRLIRRNDTTKSGFRSFGIWIPLKVALAHFRGSAAKVIGFISKSRKQLQQNRIVINLFIENSLS